jgi:hypothetical protein
MKAMETPKKKTSKMDLLTAVEMIVDLSKNSKLEPEFFQKAERPIKYISKKMGLTKEQSVLMALFIDNCNDTSIRINDFATHLDCSTTRVLRLSADIHEIEQRGLVYSCRERYGVTYRVPLEVVEAFRNNEKYELSKHTGLTCSELFGVISEIMSMRDDNEISTEIAVQRLQDLLENNKHLIFVQKLKSFRFNEDDEILLILFSHLFANNDDDNIGHFDLSFFYDRKCDWNIIKSRLTKNTHPLQDAKMIEFNNDDGFVNRESFRMTWMAKEALFPELNLAMLNPNSDRKGVIKHEDIVEKQLFYDKAVAEQVADLGQLLEEAHYNEICRRLEAKGYRSGFTCLFYGAPGTGKT